VARQAALDRVLQHLKTDQRPGIDPEFYRYQEALIEGGH
jgi:CPA1 family monovalent cation:H+ antiporter